jgi:hypothetical protein
LGQYPTVTSGAWVLQPTTNAARLRAASGGAHVCDNNAGGGDCLPAVSGGI